MINKELMKSNFFEYLDVALQFAPPGEDEKDENSVRRKKPR
jgi:hypothetical protein